MSKPKWISFDLETLGVKASSVILSIGAVAFDETTLYQEMKVNLSIEDQLRWGRTIDGPSLLYWFQATEKARIEATKGPVRTTEALDKFAGFIKGVSPKAPVWANGQDFDLGILGNLFDTLGVDRPWAYNAGRDMRTLVAIAGGTKPDIPFEGEKHDALSDAKHQARIIQFILKDIK